jgi:hypothetical protein
MTTYLLEAAIAGQKISTRTGTVYTADAFGLITGVAQNDIRDLVNCGCINLGPTGSDANAWNNGYATQVLAAAGATQGNAAAITGNNVLITVTASTEGAILKAVGTNAVTTVSVPGTVGAKIYPPLNGKIDAAATNAALAVAAGKGVRILQRSATLYTVQLKGA